MAGWVEKKAQGQLLAGNGGLERGEWKSREHIEDVLK